MYPLQVEVNEDNILKIASTLKSAYKDIVSEIATATDFGVANRKAILAQIEQTLTTLGQDVGAFIEDELPGYYELGADQAVKQLHNTGAPVQVAEGYNRIHKDAIYGLVDDTARAFGESLTGVGRSANLLLGRATREAITQQIATGLIGGEALKQVRNTIKATLQDQGLSALIDKSGRQWELDRYAEMLFRTKAVEARNRGLANRMVENGYDLVQVSDHGTDHFECGVWEGKILSVTGDTRGYPTVAQAESAGLFHPNCKHAINALVPSLARLTYAYDPNTRTLGPKAASIRKPIESQVKSKLIDPARAYDAKFKSKVEEVAKNGNWNYAHGNVKKVERATDKVINDYNGDIFGLKDTSRSVLFIENPNSEAEFLQMVKKIEKEFGGTHRIKNDLVTGTAYRKAIVNVELPHGAIAEIQVTTIEYWTAKKELGGDALYKQVRAKVDDWEKLEVKMNNLYAEARAAIARRLGGS